MPLTDFLFGFPHSPSGTLEPNPERLVLQAEVNLQHLADYIAIKLQWAWVVWLDSDS